MTEIQPDFAVIEEFCRHYHQERNHQGLENSLIEPGDEVGCSAGEVA